MATYILVIDREEQKDYSKFHQEFVSNPAFLTWWHFIKTCYLVVSKTADEQTISKYTRELLKKYNLRSTHLVLEVDLAERQGMLTEDAWKWIRKNVDG